MEQRSERPQPPPQGGQTRQHTRPHTHPSPHSRSGSPVHSHRQMHSYRARSAATPPAGEPASATSDPAKRATALVRMQTRRRRIRATLLTVAFLLVIATVGVWLLVSPTVGSILEAGRTIFQTPVAQRPGSDNGTPVTVTFPDWSKKEPVNILLIGLDLRSEDEDTRADTQIVVHIDPANKSAAMLSIPRDLWIPIPGHGEGRINTSYQLGESTEGTPGGGPGLAMATIEQNFGIPIHYYAQVDFTGFERIIDAVGGITIDVPRPLVDNEYPLADVGVTRIYIGAGLQQMDGRTALQYARSRHADSDFGRNQRQQQVLLAVRQQALNLNLITKLTDVANQLAGAVRTDLSLPEVGSLALLGREIGLESIQTVLINEEMVQQTILPGSGADVLLPRWDVIRPKVAQAFADPRLAKEAARISVQNGTLTSGMGRKVYDILVPKGFLVPDLSAPPDQGSHPVTTITDFTGGQKPATIEALSKVLGIDPRTVKLGDPGEAPVATSDGEPVDILIMVGDDRINK